MMDSVRLLTRREVRIVRREGASTLTYPRGPLTQAPYVTADKFGMLRTIEQEAIKLHRDRGGRTDWNGLALSGGGIRSAIFCLGALQDLAERNVLGNFDYLSSVSGVDNTGAAGAAKRVRWRFRPGKIH